MARERAVRKHSLKKYYGLTLEQYDDLLAYQDNKCAICQSSHTGYRGKWFAVDHCHQNNHVRGLTCRQCNTALGMLKDTPANAAACIVYLMTHGQAFPTEELEDFLRVLHDLHESADKEI